MRGAHGGVTAALKDVQRSNDGVTWLERLGSYVVGPDDAPEPRAALGALRNVERAGFERLLGEQRACWGDFWEAADIRVEGDPELQRAIRLALFQLAASVGEDGETALGARGLTGPGYRGHVFWDADVFVLPFLAATRPRAARTLLEYRARRLPAAFTEAHASGREGARFPWELPAADETSRPTARGSQAGPSLFSQASSRSTSSPTSPGEWRATSTGRVTGSSRTDRVARSSSRRLATGRLESGSIKRDVVTSTASSAPTSTTRT